MNRKELQHLYWRAGFGLNPKSLVSNTKERVTVNKDRATVVNTLFENSKTSSPLRIDLSYLDGIRPIDLKNYRNQD